MKDTDFEEVTLTRQSIFKGKIIDVVLDEVRLPSGEMGTRELVFHQGAVGIVPLTEDERLVLVRQFRKPLEKVMLEIPAGKLETTDSSHLATAQRELEEETGFQATNWRELTEFASSPGFANEILYLYEATNLTKVNNPLPQDEDELIELVYLTLEEAKSAIKSGEIYDAKTIIAVQHWELTRLRATSK